MTQFSEEKIPDPGLSDAFLVPTLKLAAQWGIKLIVAENAEAAPAGITMQFDIEKRHVWLRSRQGFRPEAPMFAISTIRFREMRSKTPRTAYQSTSTSIFVPWSSKGGYALFVNQGLRFAGWDDRSEFPEPNYLQAEHRLCKGMAELLAERIIKGDSSLMKDLRVFAVKRNLEDVVRYLTNTLLYGTWRP